MHPLLVQQLGQLGLDSARAPSAEVFARFVALVGNAYHDMRSTSDEQLRLEREKVVQLDEARERLARSEANFKTLVDRSPHPVFVHRDDRFCFVNPALAALLGHADAASCVGLSSLSDLVHPDDQAIVTRYRSQRDSGQELLPCEMRWLRVDGAPVTMEVSSARIDYDGAPATLVLGYDITDRVRTSAEKEKVQEALRRSEERYRLLFDGSPMPNFMFDAESFRFTEVNDASLELYGYTREEFLALRILDLKPPGDVPHIVAGVGKRKAGTYSAVHRHHKKDGTPLDISISSRPVTIDGRRSVLGFGSDVTQTRKLEEQLRQAQKMDAIGQLAGGVAHDFNNILAIILADSEFALDSLDDDHAAREAVADIESATHRAASLVRQLLTFSRKNAVQKKVVKVDAAVQDVEKMLSRLIGEDVRISMDLQAGAGAIEVDPAHIEQVLMNLALNARDAMPGGGLLAIATANIELDETSAKRIGLTGGRFVRLSVRDDGCGMDASTQARIFEPFFTTKEVGRGTGLGLSTVFGIVAQSRGAITVSSAVGRGTQFQVFFPRVTATDDSLAPAIKVRTMGGSETILVVEDDGQLRVVLRRMLASRGYTVLEADCARAAIEALDAEAGHVDLVLTDLVMPGMDGRTMAAQMLAKHPGTRVIFMSGYTEHAAMKGAPIGPDDHFLPKPFTAEEMTTAVRRALTCAPSSSLAKLAE